MTSVWRRVGIALAVTAAASVAALATSQTPHAKPKAATRAADKVVPAPAYIRDRVTELGRSQALRQSRRSPKASEIRM